MAAPTPLDYAASTFTGVGTSEVTADVDWAGNGNLILALLITEDQGVTAGTPTATGLTFSALSGSPTNTANSCKGYGWSATASADGNSAITSTLNSNQSAGMSAWAFADHGGLGGIAIPTPAASAVASLTVQGPNSTVVAILGDWNATTDVTVTTEPTGGTVREAVSISGNATFLVVEWTNQAAGTRNYGVTAWTGTGTITRVVAEVKGLAGGATVDIDGALSVSATITGAQDHDVPISGDRSVTATIVGNAIRVNDISGDRTVSASLAGAMLREARLDGPLSVSAALTGAAAIDTPQDGTRPVSVALTGSAAVDRPLSGQAAVSMAIAGAIDIQGRVDVDGARPVAATIAGALAVSGAASGQRSVAVGLAGAIDVLAPVRVDGEAAVLVAAAGGVDVARPVAGARSVSVAIAGTLDIQAPFTPAWPTVEHGGAAGPHIEGRTRTVPVDGSTVATRGVE